ncbi:putative immunity protein [Paenibacillus amylolyticus]|uniref:putative immunity protein n=1 Tax=Paenibacillus amylolyticus TaxID=1451 RepID=UPI003D96E91C
MAEPAFKDVPLRREIEDLAKQQDHHTLACWATECAARVLPIFEAYQLEDLRARDAINAGRGWIRGEITMVDARKAAFAAHAAAREADNMAASAASRAAGHAAATAHVKGHAVHAATYAVKAIFYDCLMEEQERRVLEERTWQYQYLLGGNTGHGERTR